MTQRFKAIYKSVMMLMIVMVVVAVAGYIGMAIVLVMENKFVSTITIAALVCGIAGVLCTISSICGIVFLVANKNTTDPNLVKKSGALDWGIFYFMQANELDAIISMETKDSKDAKSTKAKK